MVAVGAVVVSVTETVAVKVTAPPLSPSAAVSLHDALPILATALVVYADATAIALIVWVVVTVIGPVYAAEGVVDVLPSLLYQIDVVGRLSVSVKETEEVNVPPPGVSAGVAAGTGIV